MPQKVKGLCNRLRVTKKGLALRKSHESHDHIVRRVGGRSVSLEKDLSSSNGSALGEKINQESCNRLGKK